MDVKTFEDLCDLVLLEQLKNIVPDRIATYINEHKVKTAAEAAVFADEFLLMHKFPMTEQPQADYSRREQHTVCFMAEGPLV